MEGRDLQGRLQQRTKAGARLFGWWARGHTSALDIARALHYLHRCPLPASACLHPILPASACLHPILPACACLHPILPACACLHPILPACACLHPILPACACLHPILPASAAAAHAPVLGGGAARSGCECN